MIYLLHIGLPCGQCLCPPVEVDRAQVIRKHNDGWIIRMKWGWNSRDQSLLDIFLSNVVIICYMLGFHQSQTYPELFGLYLSDHPFFFPYLFWGYWDRSSFMLLSLSLLFSQYIIILLPVLEVLRVYCDFTIEYSYYWHQLIYEKTYSKSWNAAFQKVLQNMLNHRSQ